MAGDPTIARSLLADIELAFRDVPLPRDEDMVSSDRYWAEVETLLDPAWQTWDEVPPDILMANFDVLTFLSPTAFRFYLPAFLKAFLRDEGKYYQLAEFARYKLPPGSSPVFPVSYGDTRFSCFTAGQLAAVKRFAEYYDTQYDLNT